jgi:hypothetical protein
LKQGIDCNRFQVSWVEYSEAILVSNAIDSNNGRFGCSPEHSLQDTPERKRQWEREHREQRNARRRTLQLAVAPSGSQLDTRMPNPITYEKWDCGANLIPVLVIGFTFLVILLFAGWCFSGILEPSGHT